MNLPMDVLCYTEDIDILRPGSPSEDRFKEYAQVGKRLVVIVLNTKKERYPMRRVGESLWIIPTNAPIYPLTLTYALHLTRQELSFQGALQADLVDAREISLAACAAWWTARHFRKPLHIFMHGNMVSLSFGTKNIRNYLKMALARFLLPAADAVSTDADSAAPYLKDLSTSLLDRTILFPRFIDVPAIRNAKVARNLAEIYPSFKFILLSVGPLTPASNHQLAITALAGVLRMFKHAGLVIVGEGPTKTQLEAHAASLGIADRIAFESPPSDMTSYYKSAQVLINTSTADMFDDVILPAAASSIAIISAPVGETGNFLKNNENGFLCDLKDPACFVRTAMLLLNKQEIRERVRLNAMLSVEQQMQHNVAGKRFELVKQAWEAAVRNFQALTSTPTV
jgi:glycosyltransferase involved in cell wall biosynthesis